MNNNWVTCRSFYFQLLHIWHVLSGQVDDENISEQYTKQQLAVDSVQVSSN